MNIEIGTKVGNWTVGAAASKRHYVTCTCTCGNTKDVYKGSLKAGTSNGCKNCSGKINGTSHGMSGTPIYTKWRAMLNRCTTDVTHRYYPDYYGRGITVCDEWLESFESFYRDVNDIYIEGLELDRIDNDKGYSKDNVRFVSRSVNQGNTRVSGKVPFRGVSKIKSNNKFSAHITVDYLMINIGSFLTAELAARAYDKFCLYNGVKRPLNFNYS